MPYAYICPYCQHAVQTANPLPVGRPVKCPGCKKLYTSGVPGAVGTGPALAPAPIQEVVAASPPPEKVRHSFQGWLLFGLNKIGAMEVKQLLAICFFLFMFALVPTIVAISEWTVSSTATSVPLAVDLAKLEKGPAPENTHLKIGSHTACYFATVYSYTTRGRLRHRPDENTKVDYSFYPILSAAHPYIQQIRRLQDRYGKLEDVPDEVEFPELTDFRVLVRTSRFRKVGDIPADDLRKDNAVQGLVVNKINSLSTEERNLIKEDFPNVDFDKVLILDEGRRPSSGFFTFFLICVGLPFWFLTCALPGLWLYSRFGQRASPPAT